MGRRADAINEIEELTDTTEYSRRDDELSTKTVHEIFVETTGRKVDYTSDKAWHLRQILDELDIQTNSDIYGQNSTAPLTVLQELLEKLPQHSSFSHGSESTQSSDSFLHSLKP